MHQNHAFRTRKGDTGFSRGSTCARKGDGGFSRGSAGIRKGDDGFRQPAHLADRARLRYPWAEAGPGRATSGRPMLQTSSNQRDSHRLSMASVTNVVNLSPKTTIFSEKAVGLTTFVTTDQKSTRKTPPIDDVCNNTQRSAPKSQHDKPDHIGGPENPAAVPVGGGGAWPDNESTRQATRQHTRPHWCGGRRRVRRARAGFEARRRTK